MLRVDLNDRQKRKHTTAAAAAVSDVPVEVRTTSSVLTADWVKHHSELHPLPQHAPLPSSSVGNIAHGDEQPTQRHAGKWKKRKVHNPEVSLSMPHSETAIFFDEALPLEDAAIDESAFPASSVPVPSRHSSSCSSTCGRPHQKHGGATLGSVLQIAHDDDDDDDNKPTRPSSELDVLCEDEVTSFPSTQLPLVPSFSEVDGLTSSTAMHLQRSRLRRERESPVVVSTMAEQSAAGPSHLIFPVTALCARSLGTNSGAAAGAPQRRRMSNAARVDAALALTVPKLFDQAVQDVVLSRLTPSPTVLRHRKEVIAYVCNQVAHAMHLNGLSVNSTISFYVFGSVHLRTVLPDGDNDITIVVDECPPSEVGSSSSASTEDSATRSPSKQASIFGAQTPPPGVGSSVNVAELLPKVRDYFQMSQQVFVESLVFAEVRVLKLIYGDLNMDFTVGQTGGTSTVCLLHELDRRVGNRHLVKRTLLLLKAWANYEARILGGQGGYLGTYALTVMLLAVVNHHFSGHGGISTSSANSCVSDCSDHCCSNTNTMLSQCTPLRLMLLFFSYFSSFDFDKYCVTVFGPYPLQYMAAAGMGGSPTAAGTPAFTSPNQAAESFVTETMHMLISEDVIADCAKRFGVGPNSEPAACTPPTAAPLSTFPKAPTFVPITAALASASAASIASSSARSSPVARFSADLFTPTGSSVMRPVLPPSLVTACRTFPIRNMNVMDPLRPSSNLCRGVSRAHQMRIQSAVLHSLTQVTEAIVDFDGEAERATDFVHAFFPSTIELLERMHLREPVGDVAEDMMDESIFGGVCKCASCSEPSMFCVRDDALRRAEIVISPHPAPTQPQLGMEDTSGAAAQHERRKHSDVSVSSMSAATTTGSASKLYVPPHRKDTPPAAQQLVVAGAPSTTPSTLTEAAAPFYPSSTPTLQQDYRYDHSNMYVQYQQGNQRPPYYGAAPSYQQNHQYQGMELNSQQGSANGVHNSGFDNGPNYFDPQPAPNGAAMFRTHVGNASGSLRAFSSMEQPPKGQYPPARQRGEQSAGKAMPTQPPPQMPLKTPTAAPTSEQARKGGSRDAQRMNDPVNDHAAKPSAEGSRSKKGGSRHNNNNSSNNTAQPIQPPMPSIHNTEHFPPLSSLE